MFSVTFQQDFAKALFIRCLFMQRVLQVLCSGRCSLLSGACEKRGDRQATHDFYLMLKCCLFQWIVFSVRLIMFWRRTFDGVNVNFGRLLNIFHIYWEVVTRILNFSSLVGMICPLMQEHFSFGLFRNVKVFIAATSFPGFSPTRP